MRSANKQQKFMTVKQAAKYLKRSYQCIRKWIIAGRIKATTRRTEQSAIRRISVREARRVKRAIESGLF